MSLVYLPVEVSRRELLAKAFLAARLASKGHTSVVFRLDMFVRVGWPSPGYYIGKHYMNAYPDTNLEKLHALREAGIAVWHLDEEGGIMHGQTEDEWMETFRHYLDLTQLGPQDRILTWGEWQREGWERLGALAPCTVTGTPNFDIYQSKYHPALREFDEAQTNARSDYVLINTRFATANALNNFGGHIIHDFTSAQATPMADRFRNVAADGILFYRFVELVGLLAAQFPNEHFILRPHPAEDQQAYARLLAPLPNVTVTGQGDAGSWIRRSKCMIHNGCTTAVQAAVAGKPVITYDPHPELSHFTAALPNRIGLKAMTSDEVAEGIRNPTTAFQPEIWQRTISVLDSIETIADLIDQAPPLGGAQAVRRTQRAAQRFHLSELARTLARLALPHKRVANRIALAGFDRSFFDQFLALVGCAAAHYGVEVALKKPSVDCFMVMPRGAGESSGG